MNKFLLMLIVLISLVGCIEMPQTVEQNDTKTAVTTINGYNFHTLVIGEVTKPVVIVVHGGPGGDYQYLTPLKALAADYRVVFYDQRGTGLSPRVDDAQLTVEQNLADLGAVVDYFSAGEKVTLIGHSWGGMLVSGYISAHPEKVSHAVIVEPGMLTAEAANAFVSVMKESQSIFDSLSLIGYISAYPFIVKEDGEEGFDYVMTKVLNSSNEGPPYQCENEFMPNDAFVRGGYSAFNSMLKPIIKNPDTFQYDLTDGLSAYQGEVLLLSSECSVFGYEFQEKYHRPKFPNQTIHIEAKSMGHNMMTLNPEWSLDTIRKFLQG